VVEQEEAADWALATQVVADVVASALAEAGGGTGGGGLRAGVTEAEAPTSRDDDGEGCGEEGEVQGDTLADEGYAVAAVLRIRSKRKKEEVEVRWADGADGEMYELEWIPLTDLDTVGWGERIRELRAARRRVGGGVCKKRKASTCKAARQAEREQAARAAADAAQALERARSARDARLAGRQQLQGQGDRRTSDTRRQRQRATGPEGRLAEAGPPGRPRRSGRRPGSRA
jgi:hypothetical protein